MKKSNLAIFTACKGYTIQDVQPWVESLKKTGYEGKVFVILYSPTQEIAEYFKSQNFYVMVANEDGLTHIATQRFMDYVQALRSDYCSDVEYFLHTDVRDVVFQRNPEEWFAQNVNDKDLLFASAEGTTYRHEDWGGDGIQAHFGETLFKEFADYETLCSGVFGGRKDAIIDLCEAMYQTAFWTQDPAGFIDQHFYNVLIRKSFSSITKIVPADSPFTANLGTLIAIPMNDPNWSSGPRTPYNSYERFRKGSFVENMLVELPQMIDGQVCTPTGEPYFIVHQYDRHKPWKDILHKKFLHIDYVEDPKALGFYMWAYENVENVDYIFERLRSAYPESHIVLSSDDGEDFTAVAEKYGVTKYIHGTERHGYPQKPERYGWTTEEAKLFMDRFYEACAAMDCEYVMMMDEDVLIKEHFVFQECDIIMTPGIYNGISSAGMQWVASRGGRTNYPYYSFGGGSILRREKFMQAYEKHKDSFFENYEGIYQSSMAEKAIGWGWNDSIICTFMYAENATLVTNLPVIESGKEDDPAPIIHKFKKYYRTQVPA